MISYLENPAHMEPEVELLEEPRSPQVHEASDDDFQVPYCCWGPFLYYVIGKGEGSTWNVYTLIRAYRKEGGEKKMVKL